MIISHKHKFIFIKTNKTAGTSIEIALSKFCGERDVITHISPNDEITRNSLGYRGPQNNDIRLVPSNLLRCLRGKRLKYNFYNHIGASDIRKKISSDVWSGYYKFCFERNPWDKVISAYYWQYQDEAERPSMDEFLDSPEIEKIRRKGIGLYTIDGQVVVDRVCRYEALDDEVERVRLQLGLPESVSLPRAKSIHRKDKRHYRDIFTPQQRDKIAKLFQDEISILGYEY